MCPGGMMHKVGQGRDAVIDAEKIIGEIQHIALISGGRQKPSGVHLSGLEPDDHPLRGTDHGVLVQVFHIALNEDQQFIIIVGVEFFCKAMLIVRGVSVGEDQLVGYGGIGPAFLVGEAAQRGGGNLFTVMLVPKTDTCKIVCHIHNVILLSKYHKPQKTYKNRNKLLENDI